MSSFRTDVSIIKSNHSMELKNRIFTIGSCFADAIGSRLSTFKFDATVNPFGPIYNPLAIDRALELTLTDQIPPEDSFLENDGVYANYFFHSTISGLSRNELNNKLSNVIHKATSDLQKSDWLLITYGTAFIHKLNANDEVVANCHKMNSNIFTKSLLDLNTIVESFSGMLARLRSINPSIKIILTVSPVRHTKETLELNNLSKSKLRLACHELVNKHANVEYFPAYEIMMDDLRDYRFYKTDMIHPTEQAEDYIFKKFGDRYFEESTKMFLQEWSQILSALSHRPFNPTSKKHQEFLKKTLMKLEQIKIVDVKAERQLLTRQLL